MFKHGSLSNPNGKSIKQIQGVDRWQGTHRKEKWWAQVILESTLRVRKELGQDRKFLQTEIVRQGHLLKDTWQIN